jgi:hypothetical protein
MSDNPETSSEKMGRDTSYRASNFDTHLTHGCIPLFCHFWRVRSECAAKARSEIRAVSAFFGSAWRTLAGGAS